MRTRKILLVIGAGLLVLFAAGAVLVSTFSAAADQPHWAITTNLIEFVRDRSVDAQSKDVVVANVDDDRLVARGASEYAEMCAGCHLAPGAGENNLQRGLYPRPPDLTKHAVDPRRAFWVIKHGLKMSAMPAWGGSHDDETIWAIVAFTGKLSGMTAETYESLTSVADEEHGSASREEGAAPALRHGQAPGQTRPSHGAPHSHE